MDDKKKRRPRRKRRPTKDEIKKEKLRAEENEKQSELISQTVESVVDETDATQRLLEIQSKVTTLDGDIFKSLYGRWGHMPVKHVEQMAKEDNITVFERMTAARSVLSMKPETTNGMKIGQYIEERYAGKATQKIEHSGPDGGPLSILKQAERDIEQFDEFLEDMSDEELEAYEKTVKFRLKMKKKYGNDAE